MTYLILNLAVLLLITVPCLFYKRSIYGKKWLKALAIVLAMTALFDSLIIAADIVAYDEATLSGIFIGRAPIEDFAYTIATMVLIPFVWEVLRGRHEDS